MAKIPQNIADLIPTVGETLQLSEETFRELLDSRMPFTRTDDDGENFTYQYTEGKYKLTFKLPIMIYSIKQPLEDCNGDKCRRIDPRRNCLACHGDRNDDPEYRQMFPEYRFIDMRRVTPGDGLHFSIRHVVEEEADDPCEDCIRKLIELKRCKCCQ